MENGLNIVIKGKLIESIDDLIELDLSDDEKLRYTLKLLDLLNYFTPPNVLSSELSIEKENELLKRKVSSLLSQAALKEIQLSMFSKTNDYALKDLTMNPPSRKITGTYQGKRLNFEVEIQNIIAIISDERVKKIYLKEPIKAIEGGEDHKIIYENSNDVNFQILLNTIQKSHIHLIQVNRSIAVNIYKYTFKEEMYFNLIGEKPSHLDEKLEMIKIDKKFNSEEYFKRLYELKRLNSKFEDYFIHLKKMEEIDHYIKSNHIT
jgi:hypothetical protein